MRNRVIIICFLGLLMLVSSCQRREFAEWNTKVDLKLKVKTEIVNEPDVAMPEIMKANLFDPTNGDVAYADYIKPEGGYIYPNPGRYDIVVHSMPTEGIQIRNEGNINDVEVYTSEVSSFLKSQLKQFLEKRALARAEREYAKAEAGTKVPQPETSAPSDKIVYEPDHFFAGHLYNINIPVLMEGESNRVITLDMEAETVVETWEISLTNIEGLQWVHSVVAIISGQVESHFIGRGEDSDAAVNIYFTMKKNDETGCIEGKFRTFGFHPAEQSEINLDINVVDISGEEQHIYVPIDLNELTTTGNRMDLTTPVVVEKPKEGGGFVPTVEDWEEIRTEIIL